MQESTCTVNERRCVLCSRIHALLWKRQRKVSVVAVRGKTLEALGEEKRWNNARIGWWSIIGAVYVSSGFWKEIVCIKEEERTLHPRIDLKIPIEATIQWDVTKKGKSELRNLDHRVVIEAVILQKFRFFRSNDISTAADSILREKRRSWRTWLLVGVKIPRSSS